MSWLETLRTGLGAVLSHRLRSGLTMLGILIGIAAVILTVGFGEGAQGQVTSEINALGSNLLVVSPGSSTATTGIRGGFGSASTLTEADATALASKTVAPDIAAVAPATSRSETLTAAGTNWTTTVVGTTPDWLTVRARSVAEGRFLTPGRREQRRGGGRPRRDDRRGAVRAARSGRPDRHRQRPPADRGRRAQHRRRLRLELDYQPRRPGGGPDHHRRQPDLRRDHPDVGPVDLHRGNVVGRAVGGLPGGRPPSWTGCTGSARPTPTSPSRASSRC